MKSYWCFSIHWHLVTRILFRVVRFCGSLFKCNYLKNEKLLLKFLLHLWNLHQILNIFKQKMIVIAKAFPKLKTVKVFVTPVSKKRCFRTTFHSQHVKDSQTLLKSRWEHFFHAFLLLWGEPIRKITPLVICKILRVFVNTGLTMTGIPFRIIRICGSRFKCNYLQNKNLFLNFLFHFWKLHQILIIFKNVMIVIANVFRKLQTVKDLVRPLSKKSRFRTPFDSQHVKGSQTLVKSGWENFYHVFSSFWGEMIWKIFPLAIIQILAVFINTLTADGKCPVPDYENLPLVIEIQLS